MLTRTLRRGKCRRAAHSNSSVSFSPLSNKPPPRHPFPFPSVLLYRRGEHFDHRRFLDEDTICWGNNGARKDSLCIKGKRSVMLVALRLLHYLGFRTVYLLGADFKMADDQKYVFDESRTNAAIRHNNVLYDALNQRFAAMREYFKRSKFTVLNCTPESGLTAFDHVPYDEAIRNASREGRMTVLDRDIPLG